MTVKVTPPGLEIAPPKDDDDDRGGGSAPPPDPYAAYRADYERCCARIVDLEWRLAHGMDQHGMAEARLVIQREIETLKAMKKAQE